jgi:hypothetical protein
MIKTMKYTQLSKNYKYRQIANAIYAREVEYFHYDFDRINFEHLVANLPQCNFRDDVEKRLAETKSQMASVVAIVAALNSQIDDEEAYAEAVAYVTQQRENEEKSK